MPMSFTQITTAEVATPMLPAALPTDDRVALALQGIIAPIVRVLGEGSIRHLMFVGAAREVGTSLVARYAATALETVCGPVLLVQVSDEFPDGLGEEPPSLAGCCPAVVQRGMRPGDCLTAFGPGGEARLPAWLELFGVVLWDVPPPTNSPVALTMAARMDGIILVARAWRTRRQVARHVARRLRESGGKLLGVVLNRTMTFIPAWLYRWL